MTNKNKLFYTLSILDLGMY